ncbi:uncharacterized protein A4U43_C05F4130 [Asparagus officinalis]|uniref:Uncharacterized protein n=1 Tax=Asparagus officinalis TaxID=4686 RepID=A0A5P1EUN4_ASPOF|nr:uncharacterized protein A4U43_C05F4130 [Asparagus officinalis]
MLRVELATSGHPSGPSSNAATSSTTAPADPTLGAPCRHSLLHEAPCRLPLPAPSLPRAATTLSSPTTEPAASLRRASCLAAAQTSRYVEPQDLPPSPPAGQPAELFTTTSRTTNAHASVRTSSARVRRPDPGRTPELGSRLHHQPCGAARPTVDSLRPPRHRPSLQASR